MSAKTAAAHTAQELTLVAADDVTGVVAYAAPSASQPGRVNTVSLDTLTGDAHCDCTGAMCGRQCWHLDHVAAAWAQTMWDTGVQWLTAAQLVRSGAKHRLCVDAYTARIGRSRLDDRAALLIARAEYRRRARRGLLTIPDAPTPAPVAAIARRQSRRDDAQRDYIARVQAVALAQTVAARVILPVDVVLNVALVA